MTYAPCFYKEESIHSLRSEYKKETDRCSQSNEESYRPNDSHKTIMNTHCGYHVFVVSSDGDGELGRTHPTHAF